MGAGLRAGRPRLRGGETPRRLLDVIPETRYAKTVDGVHIAYQVRGDGPVDLVYVMQYANNLEVVAEHPRAARFLDRLASFSRLIMFDKRGTGLSDRRQTPDLGKIGRAACRDRGERG